MDPESNTELEDETSEEEIRVLIRKDKLVGKLLQFIADNKLHSGFLQQLFNVICMTCIPKDMHGRIHPDQYLFDEAMIDLCLSKIDLNICPKTPEPVPTPPAPAEAPPETANVNSTNQ
jgi:hypothetical protein